MPGLDFFMDCFFELNPSRQFTMGGSLPFAYSEKQAVCDEHGLLGWDRREMMAHLTALDQAYLAYLRKISETDKASDKNTKV